MNTRLLPVCALLGLLGAQTVSSAQDLPDYARYAEDAQSARLEIAIKTFQLPTGQTVDLIGVVHIADDVYYQELNRRLAAYDSVLFELVGNPKGLTDTTPAAQQPKTSRSGGEVISLVQQAASQYLNLTFQLGAVDYTRKNMVHADVSAEEFARMQRERGETMATLFARAMQVQLSGAMNPNTVPDLDAFGLIRILMSPDSASQFKKVLAKILGRMESTTAALEGDKGSAILSGRNDVAVKKVREVLADKRQRRIAVLYGVGHMPGIESSLVNDLKAKASGEQWLAAWTMPKVPPAAPVNAP